MSSDQPDAGPAPGSGRAFPPTARRSVDRPPADRVARTVPRRISDPSLSALLSAPPPFAPVDPEPPEDVSPPPTVSVPPAPARPAESTRPLTDGPGWVRDSTSHLLGGRARIRLTARTSLEGHVLESAGRGDSEALARSMAMCDEGVVEGGLLLGLGEMEGWVALTDGIAMYCVRHDGHLVTCLGAAQPTAIRHLAGILDQAPASRP